MKRTLTVLLSALLSAASLHGGDAEILATLKSKGAAFTETRGVVTAVSFSDCAQLTAADYGLMGQLGAVKQLGFGRGFDDAGLRAIGSAGGIENFSTNGMDVSDEGIRVLGTWKALRSVAFFHPGKRLKGTGLAALTQVERLTVAGSLEFADEGMAAVAALSQLKGFRTWHSGVTTEGVRKLAGLKNLTGVYVGQRLSYTVPVTLSDEVLPVLAGLPLLEEVTLSEARLTLGALGELKRLTHLKRLTLDGIALSEGDVAALKQQLGKTDVRWTAPSEAGKKRIDALFK